MDQYNTKLKQYKLFFYEQRDQLVLLKADLMKQDRLKGKAMAHMVHLREFSIILCFNFFTFPFLFWNLIITFNIGLFQKKITWYYNILRNFPLIVKDLVKDKSNPAFLLLLKMHELQGLFLSYNQNIRFTLPYF